MGRLHAREQEAVDLLYYLWKAYKAAPDEEFIMYIKDLKSQYNDGRATYSAEDLMVHAKNKYEARLLDKENTWGKPTDEQEKIVAMTAEINSLRKEFRGAADKTNKSTTTGKKPVAKKMKDQKKTKGSQKKKAANKWAWKNKPPKDNDSKEDNAFVKSFESKKYFWCPNHNNGAGMWTLHHLIDSEAARHWQAQQPKPTLPPLTLWTATRTWNDDRARVKCILGSGGPFQQPPVVGAPGRCGLATCCLLSHYCPHCHPHP